MAIRIQIEFRKFFIKKQNSIKDVLSVSLWKIVFDFANRSVEVVFQKLSGIQSD